jgi:hypothetical protein
VLKLLAGDYYFPRHSSPAHFALSLGGDGRRRHRAARMVAMAAWLLKQRDGVVLEGGEMGLCGRDASYQPCVAASLRRCHSQLRVAALSVVPSVGDTRPNMVRRSTAVLPFARGLPSSGLLTSACVKHGSGVPRRWWRACLGASQ